MSQTLPPRLVVRARRPFRLVLLLSIGLMLLGTTVVLLHREIQLSSELTRVDAQATPRSLQSKVRDQAKQNEELIAQIAVLQRKRQIEKEAYQHVDAHLRKLQDEVLAMKQEISFYRGVIAGERGRGFQIQSFSALSDGTDRGFRYRLVLTRDSKGDSVAEGVVTISVDGERNGQPVRLALSELNGRPVTGLEFRFRYYQKLEGRITLPDGFVPLSVRVEVSGAKGGYVAGSKRIFEWPDRTG